MVLKSNGLQKWETDAQVHSVAKADENGFHVFSAIEQQPPMMQARTSRLSHFFLATSYSEVSQKWWLFHPYFSTSFLPLLFSFLGQKEY